MRQRLTAAVMLACGCAASHAVAQEAPAVVPYRPSVATPADLPSPGWPELEAGFASSKGGDTARAQSWPVTFKLAWNESWGVVASTNAYAWQRSEDGDTAHSGGDTLLSLKYRLPVDETLTLGLQAGAALPTARPPIGSGRTDWAAIAIASVDHAGWHVDFNAGGARLGAVDEGQGRWQGAWAIAASHPLDDRFGVTAEVSGLAQKGTSAQSQGLVALSYSVSRALVLDVAVAAGFSRSAPDWQWMAGMTVQLGRWF